MNNLYVIMVGATREKVMARLHLALESIKGMVRKRKKTYPYQTMTVDRHGKGYPGVL
jgi:hypothetical protein